jgi:glutaredoxin
MAKEFLSQKGISYREIDVKANRAEAEDIYRLAGRRVVPIIVIDGEPIAGFKKKRIEEKLSR